MRIAFRVRLAQGGAGTLKPGALPTLDPLGNVPSVTEFATFSYDGLNRRTFAGFGLLHGKYESTITYTYDAGNRLTAVADTTAGNITRGYDGLDRLTSETTPQGTISYTYDNAGRRSTATVTGQAAVNYSYDNANRLTQISQSTSTVSFGYDADSRRTTLTLPNGIVVGYSYDDASRLTGLTYTLAPNQLGNLTYSYDLAGRVTAKGGTWARTNLPTAVTGNTYDAANELTHWGAATLTYDANGNLTNDGTKTYAWNARNQLTSMTGATFVYDGFGRRKSRGTTSFLYDGLNPVQELSGTTVTANTLAGGLDEFFMRTDSNGARWFLTDMLGSTVALTDNSGLQTQYTQYTYDPFGLTAFTGPTSTNLFQFTGRENDSTGLYYYRARYYSPTLGRFISEDPMQFDAGPDFYIYVDDSPTGSRDPSGRQAQGAAMALAPTAEGGAAVGAAVGLGVGDVVLLGWDLYQAYRLAQAYGYFLPKPPRPSGTPGSGPSSAPSPTPNSKGCRDNDDDDCAKEWEQARATCRELIANNGPIGLRGSWRGRPYTNVEDCARGFVSERCGGNPIDWGPKGPPRKRAQ